VQTDASDRRMRHVMSSVLPSPFGTLRTRGRESPDGDRTVTRGTRPTWRSPPLGNDALLDREPRETCHRANPQLSHQRVAVRLDGSGADPESRPNLTVGGAVG